MRDPRVFKSLAAGTAIPGEKNRLKPGLLAHPLRLALFLALVSSVATAQTPASAAIETEQKAPRRTPFGTPVAPDKAVPVLKAVASAEPASDILQRTGTAHNKQQLAQNDMVGEGTVTVYMASGPVTFAVTLVRNGQYGSQRILLQQPDGKLWDGKAEHLAPGGRQALEFLQTQHARGVQQFLDAPKRSAVLVDNGIINASRVVTVLESSSESTKYILDTATSRIARFEFTRGQTRDAAGNVRPTLHSYAFADVRTADGIATPFHAEHSINGVKQEELQLTKVRYSTTANLVSVTTSGK